MGRYTALCRDSHFQVGLWRCTEPEPVAHEVEISSAWDIILPYHGCYIREERGRRAFADRSRALFESPGNEYRVHHPVSGGDRCLVITLRPALLEALGERLCWERGEPRFRATVVTCPPALFVLHRRLQQLLRAEDAATLAIEESVYRAIDLATLEYAQPSRSSIPPAAERALQRVFELVQHRFRERISLDDVARHAAYSPFHLTRLFRTAFGESLHRYVTRLRLRAAFQDILEGARDLSRLALDCGFSSHSHFSAAFRSEFGFPPSRLRAGVPAQFFDSDAAPPPIPFQPRR